MKDKKFLSLSAIYAVILAAFNLLYFVIPFPKTGAAWVCYGFTVLAVFISCGISLLAFMKNEPRSKVYGISIFKVGVGYLTAQFTLTFTILSIGFGVLVAPWIPAAISVVNLAYVLIGVIVGENVRDHIQHQQDIVAANTKQMKTFRIDLSGISDRCGDAALKKSISELADEFRYSDPVSNDELSEIENNLQTQVKILAELVNSDNEQAALKVNEISILLADRNRRCRELKQ